MKITVYTITECEFSKQEKEYLTAHQLQFEEKNLETNKEFLTEMLAVSNNFAGTPVTKIEKDDGKIEVLKGFTKEEFDKTLGFAAAAPTGQPQQTQPQASKPPAQAQPPAQPAQQQPTQSAQPQITPSPAQQPPNPTDSNRPFDSFDSTQDKSASTSLSAGTQGKPAESAVGPTQTDPTVSDPLNSILADLQSKSVASNPNSQTDSKPSSMPSVPDFPAKT